MRGPCEDRGTKPWWRRRLTAERAAVPTSVRTAEAAALADAVTGVVGTTPRTVCGYVPVGTEPGSTDLLDVLVKAGHRVLLPVVTGHAPLDWAEYQGVASLVPGPYRLREPGGDRLGETAIGLA